MTSLHRVVVIGASADGVVALKQILHDLPSDFGGAVFVVLHVGKASQLPAILARTAHMPVMWPVDGEPIYPGRVYVAPPLHQMRIEAGRVRIARNHEDHHKPSIDALFRSAAQAYGAATIGVVLTGYLHDGADGLRAIKDAGGIAVVQWDASVSEMPKAAAARTQIDYACTLAEIGPTLCKLVTS